MPANKHIYIFIVLSLFICNLAWGSTYYVDALHGYDTNVGTSPNKAFKSLSKMQKVNLQPGDSVRFKRGTAYTGPFYVNNSGTANKYITVTDYGDLTAPTPSFTNPVFKEGDFGNCIRVKGSFVRVEHLYCHHTAAYVAGNYKTGSNFLTVWEMGAIYIDKTAQHCIVSHNEVFDCPVGIKCYGENTLVENNYVHDCNRVLAQWTWGPIGIWFGADYQEASYNKVFNYRAEDTRIRWSKGDGGADGGAFEIDDARNNKSHIAIHHNYTRDCQGFLEVTWTDVTDHPAYLNFHIHHNISDDYQQFIALWVGAGCEIDNNTIIRRKKNANDWGVFNITQNNSYNKIRNNIIITEKDIPVFNVGLNGDHYPNSIIQNNLYFAASGKLNMDKEGPGGSPRYGDPLLKRYTNASKAEDFSISANSPARNHGVKLNYMLDFADNQISQADAPDIGAFEFVSK